MRRGGLIATLAVFSAPALAQNAAPAPPGPEEEIKVVGKKICRMETAIGWMMPRRVCRTPTQTKEEEQGRQNALERFQYLKDVRRAQCVQPDSKVPC